MPALGGGGGIDPSTGAGHDGWRSLSCGSSGTEGRGHMGREHLQARGTAVPGLPGRPDVFLTLAGCVSVLVGSLVLVGWTLDIGALKRIVPNLVAMTP